MRGVRMSRDAWTSRSRLLARNLLRKLMSAFLSAPEKSKNNLQRIHIEPCIEWLKIFAEFLEDLCNRCGRLAVDLNKDFAAILLIARPPHEASLLEAINQACDRSCRKAGVLGYF